jgi:hypothetical protein
MEKWCGALNGPPIALVPRKKIPYYGQSQNASEPTANTSKNNVNPRRVGFAFFHVQLKHLKNALPEAQFLDVGSVP